MHMSNFIITYNDDNLEFNNDLSLEGRLKNYISNHFYPAYTISMLAPVYLVGGAIRDLMFAKTPKDLDFVVLGKDNLDWVLEVFQKFGISYTLNSFGGFKFEYDGTCVDLWLADDLFSSIQYNVDGLFFELGKNRLLSLTFSDFVDSGLRVVNHENNIEKGREGKLIQFEKEYIKTNDYFSSNML